MEVDGGRSISLRFVGRSVAFPLGNSWFWHVLAIWSPGVVTFFAVRDIFRATGPLEAVATGGITEYCNSLGRRRALKG